jgi:hypothetical protein
MIDGWRRDEWTDKYWMVVFRGGSMQNWRQCFMRVHHFRYVCVSRWSLVYDVFRPNILGSLNSVLSTAKHISNLVDVFLTGISLGLSCHIFWLIDVICFSGIRNICLQGSEIKVILRPTVTRPVCPGIRPTSGIRDKIFLHFHWKWFQTFAVFFMWGAYLDEKWAL